jgi:putative hydrolase of the HAD superfamily
MMIFFDIDGTLMDQRKAETIAARDFLESYGHLLRRPYTLADFCVLWRHLRERHARGFLDGELSWAEQRRRRMRDLFGAREPDLSDAEADARFCFYEERYRSSWCLYGDAMDALRSLSCHRLGILSNGNVEQQQAKLRQTGIAHLFSIVLISEQAGVAKPDPRIFLAACRQAQCPPHEAVHVGDSFELDASPSRTVGMRAVWLDRMRSGVRAEGIEVVHSLLQCAPRLQIRSAG